MISQTDFWTYIHKGDQVKVHRADMVSIRGREVHLSDSTALTADAVIWATGWHHNDHRFSPSLAVSLGVPVPVTSVPPSMAKTWSALDEAAEAEVLALFPMLRSPPYTPAPGAKTQSRWYRGTIPVDSDATDGSIAFVGMVRNSGLGIVIAVQTLWAVAYLEGEIALPDVEEMRRQVALENAWCRRKYLAVGQGVPIAMFEYLSVSTNNPHTPPQPTATLTRTVWRSTSTS